ncbi:MAG: hypothetical protein HUU16_10125 [Candidatus Omnitrophica bacterium]|nr:hypothetical protein [bacterium]NUN96519.1 hypothetical protein [Candidatus Omnitrophota bacterium]
MTFWDRLFRAAFVGLGVGLGWGIRGDFGHVLGASYPGAILGLAFCFVTGQKAAFRWMPLLAALSAVGIGMGGKMSYAVLHGYAQSNTFINYSYGFFCLILQGGAWGTFGCAAVGLFLERKRLRLEEWASLATTIAVSGWAAYHIVYTLIGFDINPYRSNLSVAYTGGAIALFAWLYLHKKWYGLKGAMFGYIGFGLGMAVARLWGNIARNLPEGWSINDWNVMETGCGFIGGFIFAFGMLGRKIDDPPEENTWFRLARNLGALYVIAGIPLCHLTMRLGPEKVLENIKGSLPTLGISDPAELAGTVTALLHLWGLAAFLGAGLILFLLNRNRTEFSWLPVMWLSAVMLLIQNTGALYFFQPRREGYINMHEVFWGLLILMGLYAIYFLTIHARRDCSEPDQISETANWRGWIGGSAAVYILLVFLTGFINTEKNMLSANTRWPIWVWTQGPFPGAQPTPTPTATEAPRSSP